MTDHLSRWGKSPLLTISAFGAIYILWGATYLFNKIGVSELPPFALAGIRFTTASIIIFVIAILGKGRLIPPSKALWNAGLAGFLFLTIGNGGVVWALQFIDSGFTALVISAQPLVTLIMLRILNGKRIRARSIIGIILGSTGIALLVTQKELIYEADQWWGLVMIVVCLFTWGYASIYVAKAELPKNQFVNAAYQMFFGGLILLLGSWILGEQVPAMSTWSMRLIGALSFLVICGSILAYTSFNYLLTFVSPEKVATSTYINPVVALILGWWVLSEVITLQSIIATFILLFGVYFVNSSK